MTIFVTKIGLVTKANEKVTKMENFSIRYIYDRKNETYYKDGKPLKDKEYKEDALLQLEIRVERTSKRVFISTGVKLRPDQIQFKDARVIVKNHDLAKGLSVKIKKIYDSVYSFVESDKCITIADVKNWNKADDQVSTNIVNFIRADLARRDATFAVIEYNNSFIKRLEEYGKMVTFKDVTYNHLEEFDTLLRKYIKSSPTLYKRHSLFKGYIENAKRKGLTEYNPYDDFQLKKGKSKDPVYLIESEVQKIINYKPKGATAESLERVKDLFIFQCFTGLAYTDLKDFSKEKIFLINGEEQIQGKRMKTGVPYVIFLLPQAKAILEKYDYELPVISNQKYNEYLGTLIERVGIEKEVSTHTARHTFATYLINKGVSIEAIPKIMGHTDMKQSLLYARMLGATAINEMKEKLL